MSAPKFQPGDRVHLLGGGPILHVVSIATGAGSEVVARVMWYADIAEEIRQADIPVVILRAE